MWLLAAVLTVAATQRLTDGFVQLVWSAAPPVDLDLRWREVHRWFGGEPVYRPGAGAYPPASYPLLWPLLGWVDLAAARWLWGATTLGMLAWLAAIVTRESGVVTGAGRAVAALLPLAAYASRAVMVNGQLALHLLPPLLSGLWLLTRRPPSWGRDVGAAALLLIALTKPSLTAPFMWMLFTSRGPLRPAVLLALGHAGLTALAAPFQDANAVSIVTRFVGSRALEAARDSAASHASLHHWIDELGLGRGHVVASLVVFFALGAWTLFRARGADPWLKLGVAALVARFWTYHYRYDDLLILVPVVALIRTVIRGGRPPGAVVMLALLTTTLLIPARWFFPPWPWQIIEALQTGIWLTALGYLVRRAERSLPAQ